MTMALRGLATAVPAGKLAQTAAAVWEADLRRVDDRGRRLLRSLYHRSGVTHRHCTLVDESAPSDAVVAPFYPPDTAAGGGPTVGQRMARYERDAGPLALRAADDALADADVAADSVTHLVTVSCSGFAAPGVDQHLIGRLGLSPEVARTNVSFMGCHGAINGLRVADAFAALPGAVVLLVAVELCSLHFHYGGDRDKSVANCLFADGAAALVGAAGAGGGFGTVVASGSRLLPGTADLMSWRIGDHGFEMTLSTRVPDVLRATLRPWLDDWLAARDLTVAEIAGWGVHPGGPRIIDAVEETLALPAGACDMSRDVLADYGNMSSPTVLFLLDRVRQAVSGPVVLLAFGPGLTAEIALLRLS